MIKKDKQQQTNPSKLFSSTKEAIARTANYFGICLMETIFIDYVSSDQSLSCKVSTFSSLYPSDREK